MEINVVNQMAETLHEAYGISEERSNEISNAIDKIMVNPPTSYALLSKKIAEQCNTPEELIYAIFNNIRYLHLKRMIIL